MKAIKRTARLEIRVSEEFYWLLDLLKSSAFSVSKGKTNADIVHDALACYAREKYNGHDLNEVLRLADLVGDLSDNKTRKRREKPRKTTKK